jgi:hypothetical protein
LLSPGFKEGKRIRHDRLHSLATPDVLACWRKQPRKFLDNLCPGDKLDLLILEGESLILSLFLKIGPGPRKIRGPILGGGEGGKWV